MRTAVVSVVLAAAVMAAAPRAVLAASGRVAVEVRGKGAGPVRQQIAEALERHGQAVAKPKQVAAAVRALHAGFDSDAHRAAVARRLKLTAIVVGEIGNRGTHAQIKAYGADGVVVAGGAWTVPGGPRKLGAAVGRTIWARIGKALEQQQQSAPAPAAPSKPSPPVAATPPPAPAAHEAASPFPRVTEVRPSSDAGGPSKTNLSLARSDDEFAPPEQARPHRRQPEAVETETPAAPARGTGALALEAAVGPRFVSRDLSWNKDLSGTMVPFSVGQAPAVGFQLAWYPGAHVTQGWPSYLGIAASGEYAPGITARNGSGGEYPTAGSDYWAGARVRIPFGAGDGALTAAYGQHAFSFRSSASAARSGLNIPDVAYSYARIGADGRFRLPGGFSVMVGAAYRAVLDAGKTGYGVQSMMYFQRVTVTAIDASAAVGYRFLSMFEARVGADLRRYGMDMHPEATDPIVVSGAIDQYLALWANVAVLLDGKGHAAP